MGITNILQGFKDRKAQKTYAKMLNGQMPIFSTFGSDIYASDVARSCARCIATEMGKLMPTHIRFVDENTRKVVNGDINALFRYAPNPLMTTQEFLEKITWLRELKYNVFIYPTYELTQAAGGTNKKRYTGLYPLNPTTIEFLEDEAGELYTKMYFTNGDSYTLPYKDLIHWRKDFSVNDLMGGNAQGQADTEALLKTLRIDDALLQGLEKAIKLSMGVRAIYKISTLKSDENQRQELQAFEAKLNAGDSGILPMDLKGELVPFTLNPQMVSKDTLEFLENKILYHFGVPLPILNGNFTDEQYQAFYEKTLEPCIIGLGQAISKTLFSKREREMGNEVICYSQKLLFTNTKNRIAVADILGNRGALTDNELLELFGYPPFEGGDIRHMSLNYIDRNIADQYQLNKLTGGKETSGDDGQKNNG